MVPFLAFPNKHSSLVRKFVNYRRKKFYNIGPGWNRTLEHVIISRELGPSSSNYDFVKFIIRLGGGLSPSSHTVGFLWTIENPLAGEADQENDLSKVPIDLTKFQWNSAC